MGKKFRQLTGQGQTVKGALAFYLAPKMAEDQRLKPGELDRVLKSVTPSRYEKQINGIVGTIKEQFGERLAMDESIDDLPDLLATLIPASGEYVQDSKECGVSKDKQKAQDEDDDSDDDAADGKLGDKFEQNMEKMKAKKAKDKKAKDAKLKQEEGDGQDEVEDSQSEEMTEAMKAMLKKLLGGGRPADALPHKLKEEDEEAEDKELDDEDDEDEDSDDSNDEEGEEEDEPKGKDKKKMNKDNVIIAKQFKKGAKDAMPSMDEAFRSIIALANKSAVADLQARYEAQKAVRPYIGEIDVLACDSVSDIFRMALKASNIDVRGVPEQAFPAMVKMLPGKLAMDQHIDLAQDGAGDESFRKQFPNAPTLA